ncbi:MAG: hypothetical protein AABY11_00955 [archaeon]
MVEPRNTPPEILRRGVFDHEMAIARDEVAVFILTSWYREVLKCERNGDLVSSRVNAIFHDYLRYQKEVLSVERIKLWRKKMLQHQQVSVTIKKPRKKPTIISRRPAKFRKK